ncbi:hypothetical protein FHL15_006645 [Xylaria flabelliformis]|uniref:alpha-1,2-Mannosidase n=1 Tax=Xylaria flabelliformis TaxID=2512241 RepID=A0A553HX00_9PEZI|nr:hypothetical protein FHL15_006645 [Xylaria flabelliformis]
MAAPRRPHLGDSKLPTRPKTAVDYTPAPISPVTPTDALHHLLNAGQGSPASVKVHSLPQERFASFSQTALSTPTTIKSLSNSWRSQKSALSAAVKRLSMNMEMGKDIVKRKLRAAKTALDKKVKKEDKGQLSRSSSSSSKDSSSTRALFKRQRLPRLQIPKLRIAVEDALNSACSTDTQESPSFRILEMSPASRDLKSEWLSDHPPDVVAEFHNMFSARRRVRKGEFGAVVERYQRARPTWDQRWGLRIENDNHDDRILLKHLTDALQERKDYATRLVQQNPNYPGLEPVSTPGYYVGMSFVRDWVLRDTTGLFFVWWTLSTCFGDVSGSEFSSLMQHMNGGSLQLIANKSSFDWSQVPCHFPPGPLEPLPTGPSRHLASVQAQSKSNNAERERLRESRRQEVKKTFVDDWKAYKTYAWGKDALAPISGGFRDQFSGWAATLVDSLDTLWILGLRDEFDEAVEAVANIDFGQSTSSRVNTFETNIRYLGGLIAAYDLSQRGALLVKAVELGDLIYAAFDTENRMPVDFIDFEAAKRGEGLTVESLVVSASPGTLSLELTRLSQITGDPKYYDAISRVMDVFYRGQEKTRLPGLWPVFVSMSSQDVVSGDQFTLAGGADSLYEYLPKMYALLGGLEPKYEEMSTRFLEAAKALLFRPMIPKNEPILLPSSAQVTSDGDVVLDQETEHLGCYIGGVYALAGKVLRNQGYVNIGSRLTLGCVYAYRSTPTGMMPERMNMLACESFENCEWDERRFVEETGKQRECESTALSQCLRMNGSINFSGKRHLPLGFTTAKDPRYILRPEAIESVFIMYRITGKPVWQELGWDMFNAIVNGTRTGLGTHASVRDVTRKTPTLTQEDYMEKR